MGVLEEFQKRENMPNYVTIETNGTRPITQELADYIDATYDGHYSKNKFQSTEFISDCGHGIGFAIGNILKYAQRYGRKGHRTDHRKDLMKVLHYAIIALSEHDKGIK